MIDIRLLRDDPERVRAAIKAKKAAVDFDRLLELEVRRREVITQIEELNARRRQASKEIGARVQAGEDPEEAKAAERAARRHRGIRRAHPDGAQPAA